MASGTVLVAQDELAARNSLVALLEDVGFRVLSARNGTEALSEILHQEPDAVLLDIRMPGVDDISVLKRALSGGSDSAFLAMTAFGDSSTAIEATKMGAFDYLPKPLDFDHVLEHLKRAIEHRTLARRTNSDAQGREGIGAAHTATVGYSFPVDIRLVTATSRNLEEEVGRDDFRDDLYYRLNVITIILRPLRERRQGSHRRLLYEKSAIKPRCERAPS